MDLTPPLRGAAEAGLDAHLRKLRARDEVSKEEESAIRGMIADTRKFEPHTVLVREGEELHQSILVVDGWLARTKDNRKGDRQILELHIAGDFADLHGFTLKCLDHSLTALTPTEVALVPHARVRQLIDQHPHLSRLYWFSTNLDAAIQRQWTFALGRLSARARMAHLFCEFFVRLQIIGRTQEEGFELPLTQSQLSECLGLTPVHVNRTLQSLRVQGLVELEGRRLSILDATRLRHVAEFDPDYLYLERRPR